MKTSKPNIKILLVGIVCLIMGIVGYVVPVRQAELSPRMFFKTTAGPVLFTHEKHTDPSQFRCRDAARVDKLACADCHHDLIRANDVKSCESCHGEDGYSPEDISHDEMASLHAPRCTVCHASRKVKELRSCGACHKKEGSVKPVSCEKCHAGEGFSPDDMTHEELTQIEGHWCTECHETRRRTDAMHDLCNRCHAGLTCNGFSMNGKGAGHSECAVCHLKTKS